eukprot:scaffold2113_cov393-Prasinococcus_capsulatus_cf.AAC.2
MLVAPGARCLTLRTARPSCGNAHLVRRHGTGFREGRCGIAVRARHDENKKSSVENPAPVAEDKLTAVYEEIRGVFRQLYKPNQGRKIYFGVFQKAVEVPEGMTWEQYLEQTVGRDIPRCARVSYLCILWHSRHILLVLWPLNVSVQAEERALKRAAAAKALVNIDEEERGRREKAGKYLLVGAAVIVAGTGAGTCQLMDIASMRFAFRCVAADMCAHGRSTNPWGDHSPEGTRRDPFLPGRLRLTYWLLDKVCAFVEERALLGTEWSADVWDVEGSGLQRIEDQDLADALRKRVNEFNTSTDNVWLAGLTVAYALLPAMF